MTVEQDLETEQCIVRLHKKPVRGDKSTTQDIRTNLNGLRRRMDAHMVRMHALCRSLCTHNMRTQLVFSAAAALEVPAFSASASGPAMKAVVSGQPDSPRAAQRPRSCDSLHAKIKPSRDARCFEDSIPRLYSMFGKPNRCLQTNRHKVQQKAPNLQRCDEMVEDVPCTRKVLNARPAYTVRPSTAKKEFQNMGTSKRRYPEFQETSNCAPVSSHLRGRSKQLPGLLNGSWLSWARPSLTTLSACM